MAKCSLVIFDSESPLDHLTLPNDSEGLCLSGNPLAAREALSLFTKACAGGGTLLPAAELVNEQVTILRTRLDEWGHGLSETLIGNRSLLSYLRIGNTPASAWWFTLLAERNPFKSDLFLKAAQLAALGRLLASGVYGTCYAYTSDETFNRAIRTLAHHNGVECPAPATTAKGLLKRVLAAVRNTPLVHLLAGLAIIVRFFYQGYQARRALSDRATRMPQKHDTLLVSYAPAATGDASSYRNRFYGPLQTALSEKGKSHAWVYMHVSLGGKKFADSLAEITTHAAHGTRITLLQEHLALSSLPLVLTRWAALAVKGLLSARKVCRAAEQTPFSPSCHAYIMRDWLTSTAGKTGAEGILFYTAYSALFRQAPEPDALVYCLEMHAWEKALCRAAQDQGLPNVIGFQHAAFSRNYFHFYNAPAQTALARQPLQLPLPDSIAASGEHSFKEFNSCGYPSVVGVESIRTLYVNSLLNGPLELPDTQKTTLLLAGSIDSRENASMLGIALDATATGEAPAIFLKGHPLCPFESLFKKFSLDADKVSATILTGTLPEALLQAAYVLVPTSTASIEALAFGCNVILPLVADGILMNPVIDFPEYFITTSSGRQLGTILDHAVPVQTRLTSAQNNRDFIRSYWYLEPALPRWRALLNI